MIQALPTDPPALRLLATIHAEVQDRWREAVSDRSAARTPQARAHAAGRAYALVLLLNRLEELAEEYFGK